MASTNMNLDIFASARILCTHHSTKVLSGRGCVNTLTPNSLTSAEAGAMVWSRIVKTDPVQLRFWEKAAAEIQSALASGVFTAAQLNAAKGLPTHKAEYEYFAIKAAKALIAVTRAEPLASARAEVDAEMKKNAEFEEMKAAELEKARHKARYAPRGRYSPVSPIDPMDLAMVDWDGPEPSIGRPSPVLSLLGASGDVDEEAAAQYLDLDSLAPLAEVATAERLTPVKARIVDC